MLASPIGPQPLRAPPQPCSILPLRRDGDAPTGRLHYYVNLEMWNVRIAVTPAHRLLCGSDDTVNVDWLLQLALKGGEKCVVIASFELLAYKHIGRSNYGAGCLVSS